MSGEPPKPGPESEYKNVYREREGRVPAVCSDSVFVDLDKPEVQVQSGIAEVKIDNPCGAGRPPTLQLQPGVSGSAVESEALKPSDCWDKIDLYPLPINSDVPLRQGNVYCIKTSYNAAKNAGISYKMVIVKVTSIGDDNAVNIQATAWEIPKP